METNTKLSVLEYCVVVEAIANGFFTSPAEDEDAETFVPKYSPHYGRLNAMRIFYNVCVTKCKFDEEIPHNVDENFTVLNPVFEDDEFISAFMNGIQVGMSGYGLNFANAFQDAMEMVANRKQYYNSGVIYLQKVIKKVKGIFGDLFSEENIGYLSALAENMSNGKISNEGIVEAYGKSEMFKKIIDFPTKKDLDSSVDKLSKLGLENAATPEQISAVIDGAKLIDKEE